MMIGKITKTEIIEQEHKVQQVPKAFKVQQVPKAFKVHRVHKGQKVILEQLVHREFRVFKVIPG